jgi:uncharacterized protein GlcG (DUF336 family)
MPPTLGRALARVATEAAVAEAERRGLRVCVAVVDAGGHLVAFERLDGAPFQTIGIAHAKAYSSAGNLTATHEYWRNIADSPWLVAGVQSIQGLSLLGGGLPVLYQGDVVGAVGVSGQSTMEQDQSVAEVAVAAVATALDAAAA